MVGSSSAHVDPLIGSTLGKDYRVLERIGMGGMALVYLVEHQTLLKRFAAKVLSSEHAANAEARARFTQEAHAASQLDHENIVSISDFGITPDQRPYFVMELLRGQTLADRLDAGPMTLEEAVAVGVPVARALAFAHAEGIIHRDVKPENIFLVQRSQGRWGVKVLDFGIAKVPVNDRMTKTGQVLGSPMFMSPEACRGDDVDQRADIYSLGIVLYLMLVGRVPFSDPSLLKVLHMQMSEPLPRPTSFNPKLPSELEAVLLRALEKDPNDRYPTIEALLVDLEAALPEGSDSLLIQAQFGTSNTPFHTSRMQRVPSNQSLPAQTLPPGPSRRGLGTILVIATLVLALGGAGAYAYMRSSEEEPSTRVVAAPVTPPIAAPSAAVATPKVEAPPVDANVETPEVVLETPAEALTVKPNAPNTRRPASKRVAKQASAATTAATPGSASAAPAPVATSPVEPAPPPAPTPVAPPVPAAPKPLPKPAVVDVGSMDATPSIASLDVNGPLPSSVVRRAVERVLPALRACYRTAANAQRKTLPVSLSLSFEIDENSSATNVATSGASFGSLATCARTAMVRLQTQQAPDVGTAHVVVSIKFAPN